MPQLRPGLHVVRRDDRHLQVGLDPPWRLVVPDDPAVLLLLEDLRAGRPAVPATPAAHRVLRDLLAADMLVDTAEAPPGAAGASVSVEASGERLVDANRLLRAAGCHVGPATESSVALVLADGEPPRTTVDAHLRAGRAHLPVSVTPAGVRLGPFVAPGETACVRCVDAHLGEHDPRRATVLEQVAGRGGGPRDPAVDALTTAWAVRDVLTFLEGGRPSTWSTTVEVGLDLVVRNRTWARHPYCGCSWGAPVVAAG